MNDTSPECAIDVSGLTVFLDGRSGMRRVLDEVGMSVVSGRCFALLGESGSGKTCLVQSILGLHRGEPGVVKGRARVLGREAIPSLEGLVRIEPDPSGKIAKDMARYNAIAKKQLKEMLGNLVTLVPQDAHTSISPFHRIGKQLALAVKRGNPSMSEREAMEAGREWLMRVRMYDVDTIMNRYIGELSGGMAQRVAIALALAPGPELMIADEPTTGLDATLRIEIISLLAEVVKDRGVTLVLVTHDNGAARLLANDVAVLYDGRIVESGPVENVLSQGVEKKHPYTSYLLESEARLMKGERISGARRENKPSTGCSYSAHCEHSVDICLREKPFLPGGGPLDHRVACWIKGG